MAKKGIYELLKYSSPYSILVVDEKQKLREVFCPFKVKSIQTFDKLLEGEMLLVDKVKLSSELKVIYQIRGRYFHYHHFAIII